jgi:pimeloyl-ACP methyl ester carboxylesterase
MVQERTFDAGAVAINYVEGPAGGAPLLMLHGVTGRWQRWLSVMPAFALRWQVYALDHRGHGRSGRASGAYRILDYAADAIGFLRQQVGQPAVVMGHSLGAIIAIAVAADAPESVRAVVLEDPPLGAFSDQDFRDRHEHDRFVAMRDLAGGGLTTDELIAALAQLRPESDAASLRAWATALSQLDPDVLTAIIEDRAKEGYELEARLGRIACPTLLLQGNVALGAALEDERAARAAALIPRCTFVQMPNLGHRLHSGDPMEFCRIVNDFLESL